MAEYEIIRQIDAGDYEGDFKNLLHTSFDTNLYSYYVVTLFGSNRLYCQMYKSDGNVDVAISYESDSYYGTDYADITSYVNKEYTRIRLTAHASFYRVSKWVPPNLKTKIDGQLKSYADGWCEIDGVLRKIDKMWTKVNGVLREV